jgi:hypothetical protein
VGALVGNQTEKGWEEGEEKDSEKDSHPGKNSLDENPLKQLTP